jgi:hypothetical protein
MNLDYADDCLSWDNVEGIDLETARLSLPPPEGDGLLREGQPTNLPDPAAAPSANYVSHVNWTKRRNLTQRELKESGGVYTLQDVVWLVPQRFLATGQVIKPGDVVIPSERRRFTVLEVQLGKFRQTWRLITRDLTLALDLQDSIHIERPAISYDAAGAAVKAFPTGAGPLGGMVLYSGLKCRVQPFRSDIVDERAIRGFNDGFDITVEKEIAVTNDDRVYWPAQNLYMDILTYERARRIDELPLLRCAHKVG